MSHGAVFVVRGTITRYFEQVGNSSTCQKISNKHQRKNGRGKKGGKNRSGRNTLEKVVVFSRKLSQFEESSNRITPGRLEGKVKSLSKIFHADFTDPSNATVFSFGIKVDRVSYL